MLKYHNCCVSGTDKVCVLQDRTKMMLIGVGKEQNRVCWFRAVLPMARASHVEVDFVSLWHRHLGHPSSSILSFLPSISVKNNSHLGPCDVCHRAKQTRLSFPLSVSHASEPFELVHGDLWGPDRSQYLSGASYFLTLVDGCS